MTPSPTTHLPPDLEPALRTLRRRIRRVQSARGALVTLVTALAALLILVAVDVWLSPLPPVARWMLVVAWFVLVAAVAVGAWWRPLRQPLSLLRIARWLEIRHPELDERVSTALELSGTDGRGVSGELLAELARAAGADLAGINPRVEISARRARRWLVPALVLLGCWVVLFAFAPEWTVRHLVRALSPNSRLGTAARSLQVEPGSVELIEGDSLRVVVRCEHAPEGPPMIHLRLTDGTEVTETLRAEESGFSYQLDKARVGFDYEIRSGRDTSDRFRVTVWPRPRLADARVRLEFPAYTGLPPREQAVDDGIAAVIGTRVELRSALNTPVSEVRFTLDGQTAGEVRRDQSAAGGALVVAWSLDQAGRREAVLTLGHRLGRDFEAARFNVETVADSIPEVKWTRPTAKELKVRPDEVLDLVYQATDDFGLGPVALEVKPSQGESAALPQAPPVLLGKSTPLLWRGEISLAVGDLRDRWPRASSYQVRMRVADARSPELGGPNSSVSGWLMLRVSRDAEPLARRELFDAHAEARKELEQARQAAEQARWKIESRREELARGEMKQETRNDLTKTREQLATTRESLEQLAEKMAETPHAPQSEAVRDAADKVGDAQQKLEESPMQDTAEQRLAKADEARQAAIDAEQQLRKVQEQLQRDEPRLHELARLQELAQRQREVARQAEQASTDERSNNQTTPEWRQQQAQAAWEMRDLAANHPQARAEALARQAENAKELAAEARAQAAAQQALQDNARASDPADPKQADAAGLRAELAKEQEAIREEVNAQLAEASARQDMRLTNELPEAARAAQQAAEALRQPQAGDAVEPTAAAANELSDVAASAEQQAGENRQGDQQQGGDQQAGQPNEAAPTGEASDPGQASQVQAAAEKLGDLADRQQQVAEAVKKLAAGDAAAARQQLAQMRAEQAAELAGEVREMPQVGDPSGAMQQAAAAANQGANQANQAASQQQAAAAAAPHGEAAAQLQQAAASLDQAAAGFSEQANQARSQATPDSKAPMPAAPLAQAFEQATRASNSQSSAPAASQARAAADALAQAARDTQRSMRQGTGPAQPGSMAGAQQPGQPGQPTGQGQPGDQSDENARNRQADPGVPTDLAKLGVSAEDWEQIKNTLRAEEGGASAVALPDEYRDLVRKYFERMAKGDQDD